MLVLKFSDNPWQNLPSQQPFILPQDLSYIENHNQSVTENYSYHPELYPEPYAGKLDAKIVILALNPGFSTDDEKVHKTEVYQKLWCQNIKQSIVDYPLFLIHPDLSYAPCFRWWTAKLRYFIDIFELQPVAQSILEVQLFPYHSKEFKRKRGMIPSQQFAVDIVNQAMRNESIIILMRSKKIWEEYVPDLSKYNNLLQIRNPRNPTFSEKNLPGINAIVESMETQN